MIPNHLALVLWHPYRQAVWQAIAQVEARREAGRRLSAYPYATAFFRQLTGRLTISAKDIRMIDVTYRPGDRHRRQRFEHRLTMKHTRQARIDATLRRHKRRRYQVRLAQAEIELAFITPGELDRWVRRAQQQGLVEGDLSGLVLAWTARFPCLAELDRYLWSAMPFWEARLQVNLVCAGQTAAERQRDRLLIPNQLPPR
nr:plasmid SOS inhibition protein A [Serratia bockelmannii]